MLSAPSATIAATAFAGGASDGSWASPNGSARSSADAELADRHLERRERADRSPCVEGGDRVAGGRAEHCERGDELAALLHADEERDSDEADSRRRRAAGRGRAARDRCVSPAPRSGWVRPPGSRPPDPESIRRLRERDEPVRHRVVERTEHDERDPHRAHVRDAPRSEDQRHEHAEPDDEPPRTTTAGSTSSTPSLMKRNDAPQIDARASRRACSRRCTVRRYRSGVACLSPPGTARRRG